MTSLERKADPAVVTSNHHELKVARESILTPNDLLLMFVVIIVLSFLQFVFGTFLKMNDFSFMDYLASMVVAMFAMVGGFQLYFKVGISLCEIFI